MPQLLTELRYGLRSLSKDRRTIFAELLSLGLGIGADAAVRCRIQDLLLHSSHLTSSEGVI